MALLERPPERLQEFDPEERTLARLLAAPPRGARGRGLSAGEAFRIAIQALFSNKLRTALTMLGIIIGVAAVIVMVSLGQGAKQASQEAIRKLGTNVLFIMPDSQSSRGVNQGLGTGRSLTVEDAETLREKCRLLTLVAPEYRSSATVKHASKNTRTNIYGSTPEYFKIRNLQMAAGRSFTDSEVRARARVAVLGDEVREALFGWNTAVGRTVRINGQSFLVIGVTERQGGTGFRNRDDQVTVPLSTAMRRLFGADRLSGINVQAVTEERMLEAEEEIQEIIRAEHKIREGDPPDIRIFNQADLLQGANEQGQFLTMLLSGVALVSLVVGGIGIMNIMLVTVTERTREIGIRKAIGARRKDILYQFLIESVTLSLTGGLIGVAIGVGAAVWAGRPASEGGVGMPMLITLPPILLSFGFSAAVGVFFGIYPAVKASGLDPIKALRSD